MRINCKNKPFFLLNLILTLILSFGIKGDCKASTKADIRPPSAYDTNISYNDALRIGKPIAIDFYADWCPHCQAFAPILYDIRREYESKYTFVTVNGENPQNASLQKAFNVNSYPSLFLVNPKTSQKIFVDQNMYTNPIALRREFDTFYNSNK